MDINLLANPNSTGEIWKFKDDVLVRKYKVEPKAGYVVKDEKGRIIGYIKDDYMGGTYFEPAKDYVVEKQKIDNQTEKVIIKWKDGKRSEIILKADRFLKNNEKFYINGPIIKGDRLFFRVGIHIYDKPGAYPTRAEGFSTREYNFKGTLISIIRGSIKKKGYKNIIDGNGNWYYMNVNQQGVKIIKFARETIEK